MKKYNKIVRYWLVLGCVLLFFQIIIGGITRITGSGLSITKWEIVMGTLPPLSDSDWNEEFKLYQATPQYEKINEGMSLSEFQFIYFWEYFHRLWARLMGFAFLFPLIYFLFKSYLDKRMLKLLACVFLFAALAAVFGWIMVASGLVDRPWVNAYKLSIHLSIALATLGFLLWATYTSFGIQKINLLNRSISKMLLFFFLLLCVQLYLGGIMSGTRAALVYPTWPQIGSNYIPSDLLNVSNWNMDHLVAYDKNSFAPSLFHFLHRGLGYVLFFFGIYLSYRIIINEKLKEIINAAYLLISLLLVQLCLGIMTLLSSIGTIPVLWGVLHQGIAIFLFACSLYLVFKLPFKTTE